MVHSAARPEKTRLGRGDGPAARQRLLGEAVRLFAQQGFARTSTRTIAQAAGVNISAISYYFGDKEGLYRSAFYEPFAAHDVADAIAALQGPDVPLHEALQTYFNYILAPFGQGVQMQQCMRLHMREMLEPTGLWQKEIEDRIVPLHHALQALVVRHLGLARPDDGIQRLVFAIMGIPVYLIMAQDLVQALSPNLLHRSDAIAAAVDAFSHYAQTLVEREREMRQQVCRDDALSHGARYRGQRRLQQKASGQPPAST